MRNDEHIDKAIEKEKELPISDYIRAKDIPPGQIVVNDDGTFAVMK